MREKEVTVKDVFKCNICGRKLDHLHEDFDYYKLKKLFMKKGTDHAKVYSSHIDICKDCAGKLENFLHINDDSFGDF